MATNSWYYWCPLGRTAPGWWPTKGGPGVEAMGRSLGYPAKLVTVSIGVAAFRPQEDHDEDIMVAADRALYRAKASGRNRVATGEN